MSYNKPIRRIAIVGAGVIGASWAAEYLARGFDVITTDPGPNAEANLRKYIDEAWKDLTNIGLSKGASRDRLTFTTDMKEALSKADFVQENGPERPDFKMKLFAEMDDADPIEKRASWSRREPAAGGALQGDHVFDSARCAERRRRRRGGELWTGTALGSDGAEFAMAPRRWRRRDQTLHGSSNGSIDRDDQNSRNA